MYIEQHFYTYILFWMAVFQLYAVAENQRKINNKKKNRENLSKQQQFMWIVPF